MGCQDGTSCLLALFNLCGPNVRELSYGWQHALCLTQAIFEPLTVGVVQVPPHTHLFFFLHIITRIHTHFETQHTHAYTHHTYCSTQYIYTFIYIRSSMTKAGLKFSTIVQSIQMCNKGIKCKFVCRLHYCRLSSTGQHQGY